MSKKLYEDTRERFAVYRNKHKDKRNSRRKEIRNTLEGRFKDLLDKCKQRSKKYNWEFNLTLEYLLRLYEIQEYKCAISNICMSLTSGDRETQGINPYIISVDRIDSSKGYTIDNIQLVCAAVNQIKSNFNSTEFRFWIRTISREAFNDKD